MRCEVETQAGCHLGAASDGDGLRGLWFDDDTNELVTHARLHPVDEEDDPDSSDDVDAAVVMAVGVVIGAAVAAVVAGVVVLVQNREVIKDWVKRKVSRRAKPSDQSEIQCASPVELSESVDVALDDCRTVMSSDEAKQRLVSVFTAAAFVADQMRTLQNARVEDVSGLEPVMVKLASADVVAMLNQTLQSDHALLDDAQSEQLLRLFGGGVTVDGSYKPISSDGVRHALRMTADCAGSTDTDRLDNDVPEVDPGLD